MADPEITSGTRIRVFLPILALVYNILLLITVAGMAYWWDRPLTGLEPYFLDNMLRMWHLLPSLWLAGLIGAFIILYFCRGRLSDKVSTSSVMVSILSILLIMFFVTTPIYPNRVKAYDAGCFSNLRQVSVALLMYAQDYDDQLPQGAIWNEAIYEYVGRNDRLYRCPTANLISPLPSYSMNRELSGMKMNRLSADTVLVFESIPGKDFSGGPELLPSPPRHHAGHHIAVLDGHVRWVKYEDVRKLRWIPGKQ